MPRYGKPDATGRSSGKWTAKEQEIYGPPKGEPWTWQTIELMESPAWRAMGINTRRLIDFLQIEHRNHGGRENGNLKAPYDHLVEFGLTRSEIPKAIEAAEYLGLTRTRRGGRWAGTNQPSTFRLTFFADKHGGPATNEWKRRTEEQILDWQDEQAKRKKARKRRRRQKQIPGSDCRTTVVRLPELRQQESGIE